MQQCHMRQWSLSSSVSFLKDRAICGTLRKMLLEVSLKDKWVGQKFDSRFSVQMLMGKPK